MQRAVGEDSWESLGLARRSNQSILKETRPEYSLEGLMLKLKLQYFGHLMRRTDSLEKPPILGKIEGGRRRRQRMRWLDDIADSMDMIWGKLLGVGEGQGGLACCSPWGRKESDTTEQLNWTECNYFNNFSKWLPYSLESQEAIYYYCIYRWKSWGSEK